MEMLFYILSIVSVVSTVFVILSINPMHALLYLVLSLLSVSCIFFLFGAYFAGVLEIIIYSGAIMVLFIFVVMILNVEFLSVDSSTVILKSNFKKILLLFMFFMIFLYVILISNSRFCDIENIHNGEFITLKNIGCGLFGSYVLVVELASMLLLSALVISLHIGRFTENEMKKDNS